MIVLVMSVILCSVAIITSAYTFSDTNETGFKNHANDIAYTVAANIDGDTVSKVTGMVLETFAAVNDDEIVSSDDWGSTEFEAFLERSASVSPAETDYFCTPMGSRKQKIRRAGDMVRTE